MNSLAASGPRAQQNYNDSIDMKNQATKNSALPVPVPDPDTCPLVTPKSDEVRKQLTKIQLWIDESTWLPAQQRFEETGSGDYFIIRYKNVMRNVKIPDSEFKQHWPHGTTHVKPQG